MTIIIALTVAVKLYGVNATIIIFVFVFYYIVLYCIDSGPLNLNVPPILLDVTNQ